MTAMGMISESDVHQARQLVHNDHLCASAVKKAFKVSPGICFSSYQLFPFSVFIH
jgi:hypothetical protein